MSTLKTINIIHPTGTITNIVNDANGNVGIGTSTPALSSGTNRTYLTIKGQGSLSNDGIGVLQLATNTAGSIATNLGNIEWHIPDNSSSSSTRVGFIAGYATGSTANNRGGWIDFATKPDGVSGGGSVYMSVNSSQQIGISTGGYGGAIATNFRLEIVGMAGSNTGPATTGTTQDTSAVVRIRPGGGFTAALDIGSGGGTGAWIQSTDTANLATNYALLLNPNGGNVGIGTISPTQKLHVVTSTNTGTAADNAAIYVSSTNRNGYFQADGLNSASLVFSQGLTEKGRIFYDHTSNFMAFGVNGAWNASEKMRIDTGGNVYIGSSTALISEKLLVKGAVLGGTIGNVSYNSVFYTPDTTNITRLNILDYRFATGTSHPSSMTKIQRRVDSTDMGYVGFDSTGTSVGWQNTEAMRIDSNGRVTMPYQTGFHASYGTIASQSWSGTAAFQALQLNGQATFGARTTGYNTTTYRFTAPVAGMYMLYSRFTPNTNGQTGPEAIFSINGSGAYYAGINYSAVGIGSYVSTTGELLVQLAASDWVELRIVNNNNVSFTLDLTRCCFGGYLVG
jgi:hypothetical protein